MGDRSVASAPTFNPQTDELDSRFGQARQNADKFFSGAKTDVAGVARGQRQSALADFAASQEGQRGAAISSLPPSLRNSGVGQSAIAGADRSSSANAANISRGINQTEQGANQALIGEQLSTNLGLDQASIQAFLNEIQSARSATAGVAGAKIASDTAANTGGLFGRGGFFGLGF